MEDKKREEIRKWVEDVIEHREALEKLAKKQDDIHLIVGVEKQINIGIGIELIADALNTEVYGEEIYESNEYHSKTYVIKNVNYNGWTIMGIEEL